MCTEEVLGLIPYNFEPEYSAEELENLENLRDVNENTVVDLEEWCDCKNCIVMPSADENLCCKSSDLTLPNMDSNDCITEHSNFDEIVLNPVILEVAYIQIMIFKGQRGRAPDQLSNK